MADQVDCLKALELLQDYLKQELTPDTATQIAVHLDHCRSCFEHVQFEQSFLAMLEVTVKGQCCPDRLRARILLALRKTQ